MDQDKIPELSAIEAFSLASREAIPAHPLASRRDAALKNSAAFFFARSVLSLAMGAQPFHFDCLA